MFGGVKRIILVCVALVLVVACSGGSGAGGPSTFVIPPTSPTTIPWVLQASTSLFTIPTTAVPEVAVAPPLLSDTLVPETTVVLSAEESSVAEQGAVAAWVEMTTQIGSKQVAPNQIGDVAREAVASQFDLLISDPDDSASPVAVTNYPYPTVIDAATVQIEDCMFVDPHHKISTPTRHLIATAEFVDDTWKITDFTNQGESCIPAAINDPAIEAYKQFWVAREASGNPPDPNHLMLEQTMTGEMLTRIKEQLQELAATGKIFNGQPRVSPFVYGALSPAKIGIADCLENDGSFGIRNVDRTSDRDPFVGTESTLIQLELVDGQWRVSALDVQEDHTECLSAEAHGLQRVGD